MANSARIRIGADVSEAEKGINRVTEKLNQLNKVAGDNDSIGKLKSSWDSLASTIKGTGLASVIGAEVDLLKKELEFINETTEAYNIQLKAETQLAAAAKNNPYLNAESVDNLKNFASSVQAYSIYGDEFLMPFMSELAATGRTEQEIMDIVTASADVASTGMMEFGAAISALNATFTGATGALGRQVAGLKDLTKEQLKTGAAVDLVKEQFKGLAAEVASATGAAQQSSNTWGDFKEEIGKITKPAADGWFKFWEKVGAWGINTLAQWNNWIEDFEWKLKNQADYWSKFANDANYSKLTIDNLETAVTVLTKLQDKRRAKGQDLTSDELDSLIIYKEMYRQKKAEYDLSQKQKQEAESLAKIQNQSLKENLEALESVKNQLKDGADESERATTSIETMQQRIRSLNSQAATITQNMRGMAPGTEEYQAATEELERIANRVEDIQAVMDTSISTVSKINALTEQQNKLTAEIETKRKTLLQTYKDTVKAAQNEINLQRTTGSTVSVVTERQKILEASQKAYQQYLKEGGIANAEIEASIKEQNRLLTQAERDELAINSKQKYLDTMKAFEDQIQARRNLNEEIDEQTYKTEKLATQQKALMELITGSKGTVTVNNSQAKIWIKDFKELAEEVKNFPISYAELEKTINEYAYSSEERQKQELEAIRASFVTLQETGALTVEQFELVEKAIAGVDKALKEFEEEVVSPDKWEVLKENVLKVLTTVEQCASQLSNAVSGFSNLAVQNAQNEATVKTAALEKEYATGLKSEEQYQREKEKIEKESARRQYKAQMWAWAAQLLQIESSTALGVMNAYSSSTNTTVGMVMAALVAAAGAAQLATAIASKPVPPSYAGGGFIGGVSGIAKGGDDSIATVKRGELVLNGVEQRNLMNMLQGGVAGGCNVEVKNYMGDSANVSTKFDEGKLTVMINRIVKSGMENGDYTQSLTAAQNLQNGVSYL